MSIALIGIILVQVYWIKGAIENKQKQFENDVTIALAKTSEKIREREELDISQDYNKFIENNRFRVNAGIKSYIYERTDTNSKEKFTYRTTLLEENFKIPGLFENDSTFLKKITGKQSLTKISIETSGKELQNHVDYSNYDYARRFNDLERNSFLKFTKEWRNMTPIENRITPKMIRLILKDELNKRNINQKFNFGIYNKGLATKIKSGYFKIDTNGNFYYPILEDKEGNSNYKLYVTFPNEHKNLISGVIKILLLSLFFIIIIIATFSISLYQLMKQKKISKIKSDFINNMTHEFKTPIATINLALDAIKNPKVINSEEKIKRYVQMIRDENKRMHGQVESVLRISKLEKKQIDIPKDAVNMTTVIKEGIEHIWLLTEDKKGHITTHFEAIANEVLGDKFHLINVVVNILENAIKYSKEAPKIDVFTENTNKYFILKIKDEGIGMSKQAQKHVFDKFYREHSGNIHNVKGHGLGLAYVKEIINNHQGVVHVESEKGKGSTFTIKLPLI